jgi:O-antigen/teichoic acid export membrane protein
MHWFVGILATGTIIQSFIAIEFWFESQMQWKFSAFAKTSAFLLLSIVKIGLILVGAPLIAFAWAALAETVLAAIGLVLVYRRRGYSIRAWRFSKTMTQSLLHDSWPLIFSTLLTLIYLRVDQVMIGNMIGSEELGNYSVAVRISEVWNFIPMVICSSIFPAVVRAEAVSEDLYYAHLQRLYGLMAFLAYVVALPVSFFADEIVQLLFASAYSKATPLLAILIWAGLFTSLGTARNVFIISQNRTRVNLVSIVLGAAFNVLLNFLLIPRHGAMGAVIATLFSYWFAVHGTCFLFPSLRKTGWMLTKAIFYPKFW